MENTLNKDRGTLLWRFSQKFQFAADRIIPDSLVFDPYIYCVHSGAYFYGQGSDPALP